MAIGKIHSVLIIIFLTSLLGGCISSVGQYYTADKVYRLEPKLGGAQRRSMAHIFLPRVQVSPALDTPSIALFKPGLQQSYIANSRWPNRLSDYFHATVFETLSRSNAFLSVSGQPVANQGSYQLLLRLSAFHAEYSPSYAKRVNVVFGMEALLIDPQTQRILRQYRYERRQENLAANTSKIVATLNQILGESLTAMIADLNQDLPAFY